VEVVCRTGIDGKLVHLRRVETGFFEQLAVGLREQLQAKRHQIVIRAGGHTHTTEVQRHRADLLVRVELVLWAGFQKCNGAVANEVVELIQQPGQAMFGRRIQSEFGKRNFKAPG
jgi:hypothetical protein